MKGIVALIIASCVVWVGSTVAIVTTEMPVFTACNETGVELVTECTEEPKTARKSPTNYILDAEPTMVGNSFLMDDLDAGDLEELLAIETEPEPVKEWEVVETRLPYVTYGVSGKYMDDFVYEYLVSELRRHGIEWWLPIAVCEAFQESGFNPNAKAPHGNGFDSGLFQYYDRYWSSKCAKYGLTETPNNIFDPIAQVYIYCCEFAERLNSGASIEKALSDHFTGGQGYSETYVHDVLKWQDYLTTK